MDRHPAIERRLGLNIPHRWWPTSALLKEIEASGFHWVQLPSPPASVLAEPRQCIRHSSAVARSLSITGLRSVFHAPAGLRLGTDAADRVFEGALSYAAECGAEQVVYHALALAESPTNGELLSAEERSLRSLADLAGCLDVMIAVENLAPVFPGLETLSAIPASLRSLTRRIGSPALSLCLDLGHANITAGLRHTSLPSLVEPVLDVTSLFHLHDNLGARRRRCDERPDLDPLRLDLHLAPGRGEVPWGDVRGALLGHDAPLLLEVHPPHRPAAGEIAKLAEALLAPAQAPASPTTSG